MQMKISQFGLAFMLILGVQLNAQETKNDTTSKRFFVGSTLLMLGNFIPDDPNPPEFIQLNLGYRVTPKDAVSFEFKRSIYTWPLGIPWGPSFDAPGLNYPGHVRILAPTLVYQRFWWKGVYTSIHALNAFEKYLDENNKKIGNGYTLYLTGRFGYHVPLFKDRFFLEPSIGLTYWPIRINTPEAFKLVENTWPNYFLFEPGFHFGFKF